MHTGLVHRTVCLFMHQLSLKLIVSTSDDQVEFILVPSCILRRFTQVLTKSGID